MERGTVFSQSFDLPQTASEEAAAGTTLELSDLYKFFLYLSVLDDFISEVLFTVLTRILTHRLLQLQTKIKWSLFLC